MTNPQNLCPSCESPLPQNSPGGLCPRCSLDSVIRKEEHLPESQPGAPDIDGIELLSELGEGGFGIVYRANQTGLVQRKVALKVLKPGVDTRQVLRRFEIEQQALAHLEHPAIARFYEAGQTKEGYPYFTMELVEGVPIHEAVGGQSLTDVIGLFIQICEGVAHAHDHGVIHRDLKPGNILVNSEGRPKVIDFGLAKALDSEQAPGMTLYTGGESWLGTPGYAAPEQVDASEIEPDERADLYSLGAILYHLLTGMNPEDARELSTNRKDLPPPSEIALQNISPGLDAITLHALAPNREDRYRNVRDLMADLRRHLNGDPLSASQPRKKSHLGIIIASAVALCLGIGWLVFSQLPKKADQEATEEVEETLIDIINQDLAFEEIGFITLKPDEDPIPPFLKTNGFGWTRFRKPDGEEFILSHDCMHGSPTVTHFFVGGKRPDDPGVRIIPFNSEEDKALLNFYLSQIEKSIGVEEAEKLDKTEWDQLKGSENSRRLRMLKNLLGSVYFVKNHRNEIEWSKDYDQQ